jgi:hypothetical protein
MQLFVVKRTGSLLKNDAADGLMANHDKLAMKFKPLKPLASS